MKLFKKTYKFICSECGEFTHTDTEYCENCGVKALRKATKDDYEKYEKIKISKEKESRKVADKAEKEADKARKEVHKVEKAEKKVEKAEKKAEKAAEKNKEMAEEV